MIVCDSSGRFTELDKKIAKRFPKFYTYIARNGDGELYLYPEKPVHKMHGWYPMWADGGREYRVPLCDCFHGITCDDDEPVLIRSIYEDPVLDDVERRYLGNFLRPFRKRVEYVFKKRQYDGQEQIVVKFKNNNNNNPKMSDGYFNNFMYFPLFDGGKMYKGMTVGTKYSLDMLGLFTEGDE